MLLSVGDQPGFLGVVSGYAPTGGDRFEDLLMLDFTDPRQWLLIMTSRAAMTSTFTGGCMSSKTEAVPAADIIAPAARPVPVVCVRNLHVRYGKLEAVQGISFNIPRGEGIRIDRPPAR